MTSKDKPLVSTESLGHGHIIAFAISKEYMIVVTAPDKIEGSAAHVAQLPFAEVVDFSDKYKIWYSIITNNSLQEFKELTLRDRPLVHAKAEHRYKQEGTKSGGQLGVSHYGIKDIAIQDNTLLVLGDLKVVMPNGDKKVTTLASIPLNKAGLTLTASGDIECSKLKSIAPRTMKITQDRIYICNYLGIIYVLPRPQWKIGDQFIDIFQCEGMAQNFGPTTSIGSLDFCVKEISPTLDKVYVSFEIATANAPVISQIYEFFLSKVKNDNQPIFERPLEAFGTPFKSTPYVLATGPGNVIFTGTRPADNHIGATSPCGTCTMNLALGSGGVATAKLVYVPESILTIPNP